MGWGAVSNKMPGCHLANAWRSRSKHILQWRYRNEVSIQFNIGHLWFPHFLWRRTARIMATVELMPDHENKVFAFGILLVSGFQHDLHVLPVSAATILDFWLSLTAAKFWKQEWNWIFIYCCATSVLCVQSEFNMSLQTYPYLKQKKNTKHFLKVIQMSSCQHLYLRVGTWYFHAVLTIAWVYHLARII